MGEKQTCVLCGCEFEGYGNDPSPVVDHGVCCDDCNMSIVVPARMDAIEESKDTELSTMGNVDGSALTIEDIRTAFRKGLLTVNADFSVMGETQFSVGLFLHPTSGYSPDREVFIGSIPGDPECQKFLSEWNLGTDRVSDEGIRFLLDRIQSVRFIKMLRNDIENTPNW